LGLLVLAFIPALFLPRHNPDVTGTEPADAPPADVALPLH
jgi:hypothetical protein